MRLKDEDIKEIARLVDEGRGPNYIARKLNYSVGSMKTLISRYKKHGLFGILRKANNNKFSIEEKISIINRYYFGESKRSLAIELNLNVGVIHQWISKYEKLGYNGLIDNRGRPGKTKMGRPRKKVKIEQSTSINKNMVPLTDEERQELNELRKKTYQQQMEIDCLKKIQALVQKRQNQQTKKK